MITTKKFSTEGIKIKKKLNASRKIKVKLKEK
jgi:hypothetical protein